MAKASNPVNSGCWSVKNHESPLVVGVVRDDIDLKQDPGDQEACYDRCAGWRVYPCGGAPSAVFTRIDTDLQIDVYTPKGCDNATDVELAVLCRCSILAWVIVFYFAVPSITFEIRVGFGVVAVSTAPRTNHWRQLDQAFPYCALDV